MALEINLAFRGRIPALDPDEYARLEASLLADGCIDPLVVWSDGERETLIDGHNRYAICEQHGIDFETVELDFEDEDEALLWIIDHQLARRNLSDFAKAELALQAKPLIEARAKAQQIRKPVSASQNSAEQTPIDTRAEVAARAGVSHDTIGKVERIKQGGAPALIDAVRSGEVSINLAAQALGQEAAAEYIGAQLDAGKPLTRAGLRDAVRQSVAVLVPVQPSPQQPAPAAHKRDTLWVEWTSAVKHIAELEVDLARVAAQVAERELAESMLADARAAAARLPAWIAALTNELEACNEIRSA